MRNRTALPPKQPNHRRPCESLRRQGTDDKVHKRGAVAESLINLCFNPKAHALCFLVLVVAGVALVGLDVSKATTPKLKGTQVPVSITTTEDQPWPSLAQKDRKEKVLLTSMVFGEKYIEQRRFQMFVKTFATSGLDLLIVGSPAPSYPLPPNIKHLPITWSELVDRIVRKVFGGPNGLDANKILALKQTIPYKSCDFRAIFGYLFAEYTTDYQWWGYIDNDSLVGNLAGIFSDDYLQQWDIVSGTVQKASGPFQLWRNVDAVNNLFWKVAEYEKLERILLDEQYQSFDEWGQLGTKFASIEFMVEKYAPGLGLRYTSNTNRMWDQGECEQEWAFLGLKDDPKRADCGECIYNAHADKLLVRGRDRQEMFFCHYEGGKIYHEESLADDDRFAKFLEADTFRVTYWHGFDFVDPTANTLFDVVEAHKAEPKRVLLTTYVFGDQVNRMWFWMFAKTVALAGFDLAIIGDQVNNLPVPVTTKLIKISWSDYVDRLVNKVFGGPNGLDPEKIQALKETYPDKVRDYKPLFAHLFPEEVEGYKWWGHIDNDALVGNLTKFFTTDMLEKYDILSGDSKPTWGPLTLYRNEEKVNSLFWKAGKHMSLQDLFLDPAYKSFDEEGQSGKKEASMSKLIEENADELGLRVGHRTEKMWDMGECDADYPKLDPSWTLLDDPNREDCGECVYDANPSNGKLLTRTRDDQEVFLCKYQLAQQKGHEASLQPHDKFGKLYITDKIRVTFQHGFDFPRDDDSKLKESWQAIMAPAQEA